MVGLLAYVVTEEGAVYEFRYAGIGSFSDIKTEANASLFRTFC